jgi:uncharacterized delta-60 repeat protein
MKESLSELSHVFAIAEVDQNVETESSRQRSPRRSATRGSRPWLERLEARTLLNAGDLDPTFGMSGMVTTTFQEPLSSYAAAAAQQADGKIVMVGEAGLSNTAAFGAALLARYSPGGILDPSFGNGGIVTPFAGYSASSAAVAIQGDGRIIVAGAVGPTPASPTNSLALARYNPDGSLDVSFGTSGSVLSSFSGVGGFRIGIQSTGKIVVSMQTVQTVPSTEILVRYNPDGSLDSTFGTGGMVTTSFLDAALEVQPDDKIITVGQIIPLGSSNGFAVARLNPDGSSDSTFGSGGMVTTQFAGNGAAADTVALQSDGKIVVAGVSDQGSGPTFALARYNTNGSLDAGFGPGGKVTSSIVGGIDSLTLQSDGTIVAAGGQGGLTVQSVHTVARYTPAGTLDSTFGANGTASLGVAVPVPYPLANVLVESGGRIVVAVTVSVSDVFDRAALVGLTNTGASDATFGTMGQVLTTIPGPVGVEPATVLIQPDGKILVASTLYLQQGSFTSSGSTAFALARYNPDSTLDTAFGSGGRVTTSFGDPSEASVTSAFLLPDGKILVAGAVSIFSTGSTQLALARYTPDGQPDTSFGNGGTLLVTLNGVTYGGGPVVVEPDGKLLLAGIGPGTANGNVTLVRLNPDGSQDTTFAAAPISLRVDINPARSEEPGLALQADGKILLSVAPISTVGDALVRLNATGSLDATFGNGGIVTTDVAGKIHVQIDGRILVVGLKGLQFLLAVDRFFPNGNPDTTFGIGGEIDPNLSTSGNSDLLVQTDNKIIVAGTDGLERFDPNGNLDPSFGTGGKLATNLGASLALQSDGRIIASGSVTQGPALGVVRFLGDAPIADNNQRFVTHLYLDLLERSPDGGGLMNFTTALNTARLTRMQFVQVITSSAEYRTLEVQGFYGRFFGRPADPAGLTNWVNFLNQGGTAEQLEALFIGSVEYFNGRGGGTANGFLQALYGDVLGRPVDTNGAQTWGQALANGVSPAAVGTAILASQESDHMKIEELYGLVLHRPADASGLNTYTTMLQQCQPDTLVLAILASSGEYFART